MTLGNQPVRPEESKNSLLICVCCFAVTRDYCNCSSLGVSSGEPHDLGAGYPPHSPLSILCLITTPLFLNKASERLSSFCVCGGGRTTCVVEVWCGGQQQPTTKSAIAVFGKFFFPPFQIHNKRRRRGNVKENENGEKLRSPNFSKRIAPTVNQVMRFHATTLSMCPFCRSFFSPYPIPRTEEGL